MRIQTQRYLAWAIWTTLIIVILYMIAEPVWRPYYTTFQRQETEFGVTFSTKYTEELGLEVEPTFNATLIDLDVNLLRIPVYWDEIEQQEGVYDLSQVEWMLDQAEAADARVILAVGQRVPRWPECHPPTWTKGLSREQVESYELAMVETIVTRFKNHPALYRWQVHNEGFFSVFGECDKPNPEFIAHSVKRVHALDPEHEVMTTDSGELSTWLQTSALVDTLGVSVYRTTWNKWFGYFHYPIPSIFYRLKAMVVSPSLTDQVIVSELQAEPWVPGQYEHVSEVPVEEQYRSMSPERFAQNVKYAENIGFSETLLWGVEWWYWLKVEQDEPVMWEIAKKVFKK